MAGTATPTSLDITEQVARISKMLDDAAAARAETTKFVAEHDKLAAEARKFKRDRDLAIWQVVAATAAATAGLIGATAAVVKLLWS